MPKKLAFCKNQAGEIIVVDSFILCLGFYLLKGGCMKKNLTKKVTFENPTARFKGEGNAKSRIRMRVSHYGGSAREMGIGKNQSVEMLR